MRDYQREMVGRLQRAWERYRSVMMQMPTGTGKTHVMAETIRRLTEDGRCREKGGILIVAHRQELIEQIRLTLAAFGIAEAAVVESIQKLSKHLDDVDMEPQLIIIDEAHHALAKTYKMLWDRWPEARFLGLTATPCRLNGAAFTDLFDTLLQSWPIQEFIEKGWLSDFEYVSAAPDSEAMRQVASLDKRGTDGDYQTKQMAMVMDTQESVAHLYQTYHTFVNGKKGIVYAIDRQHAQHIAVYYQQQGVRASVIDAKTPADERKRLVMDYRNGGLKVLVNVDLFSEGFDCPEVEFIQLARPTLSLSKYLQQVGRGMRISEGKEAVTILDHVGLYQTFGLPTEDRDWELLFSGRERGMAKQGESRSFIIRRDEERRLVNLEMVVIKRRGERSTGVEVFMKDGRYGVMKDGQVSCPAEFESVKWLEAPYFVMGVYPFYVYHGRVTVIDKEGRDLRAALYGNVRQEGDVFTGKNVQGKTVYWDAKGGRSYAERPQFSRLLRFEVAKSGQQLFLRYGMKGWEQAFSLNHVFVGKSMTIMGNVLFYHNNQNQPYRVCGYKNGLVFVECREKPGYTYAYIMRSGNIEGYVRNLPKGLDEWPDISELGLKRMS